MLRRLIIIEVGTIAFLFLIFLYLRGKGVENGGEFVFWMFIAFQAGIFGPSLVNRLFRRKNS